MDPVAALREIAFYKDRAREESRRVMAYRKAADVVAALTPEQREKLGRTNGWQTLAGVGPKTAAVIAQAWAGREPDALVQLRTAAADLGGGELRTALRGDLHLHSNWSDGGAPISEMMATAQRLGHEYCALTDHSPRLTVANGLSADRLRQQLDVIDEIRDRFAPMRLLTGIEVDILEDGSLDQEPELLERLDVVVASVHSKLSMDAAAMTRRMVRAVSGGQANVLGHCTGRLVEGSRGTRPESKFDAEAVFAACATNDVAVEINSRPERRDPPTRLLNLALETGCLFSIDTDAHAPGQLDFLGYGAQRALDADVPPERIVNTWPAFRRRPDLPAGIGPRHLEIPADGRQSGPSGAPLRGHRAPGRADVLVRHPAGRGVRAAQCLAGVGEPCGRNGFGVLLRRRDRRVHPAWVSAGHHQPVRAPEWQPARRNAGADPW
jgi:putative hydrolase